MFLFSVFSLWGLEGTGVALLRCTVQSGTHSRPRWRDQSRCGRSSRGAAGPSPPSSTREAASSRVVRGSCPFGGTAEGLAASLYVASRGAAAWGGWGSTRRSVSVVVYEMIFFFFKWRFFWLFCRCFEIRRGKKKLGAIRLSPWHSGSLTYDFCPLASLSFFPSELTRLCKCASSNGASVIAYSHTFPSSRARECVFELIKRTDGL